MWWSQGLIRGSAPGAAQMAALSRKAAEAQLQLTDSRRDAAEVTRYSLSSSLLAFTHSSLGLHTHILLRLCLAKGSR